MARNVVVTGGGTGIGLEIARRFAEAGDAVVIVGRRRAVLESAAERLGAGVSTLVCDLADPDAVEAALGELPARIDVLVNNAGSRETGFGAGPHALLARWRGDFERNVLTAVLLTESVRDRLTPGEGRVITISSIAALRGAGSYGAAKASLHAWNHFLAAQLGPPGSPRTSWRPARWPAPSSSARGWTRPRSPAGPPAPCSAGSARPVRWRRPCSSWPRPGRASSPPRSCTATVASCSGVRSCPARSAGQDLAPSSSAQAAKRRSRRLLVTTQTEEKAIAAPATIGFSRPAAASGTAATL